MPSFWPREFTLEQNFAGIVLSEESFLCQSLDDFDVVVQEKRSSPNRRPDDEVNLCQIFQIAREHQFSATNLLPKPRYVGPDMGNPAKGFDDVDWDSIMLYGAAPGRDPILKRSDGTIFQGNLFPIPRDVIEIQSLVIKKY